MTEVRIKTQRYCATIHGPHGYEESDRRVERFSATDPDQAWTIACTQFGAQPGWYITLEQYRNYGVTRWHRIKVDRCPEVTQPSPEIRVARRLDSNFGNYDVILVDHFNADRDLGTVYATAEGDFMTLDGPNTAYTHQTIADGVQELLERKGFASLPVRYDEDAA